MQKISQNMKMRKNFFHSRPCYARATHRRLIEIGIMQDWLKMHQSKFDLSNPDIKQTEVFQRIFDTITHLLVAKDLVKAEAKAQLKLQVPGQRPDGGYEILRARLEEVITTLLKEFRQAYLIKKKTDNESENNKLQTMYGICEDIESAKSPEGSVLNVLEYIKHHFNEHIDMAKIASFFSYVASELTKRENNRTQFQSCSS